MSYQQGQDAVRLTLSIKPDDSDLKRMIDEAVAARTADLEQRLAEAMKEKGGRSQPGAPGGGRSRRKRREPGPHTVYAGPPPSWPPHGTLPGRGGTGRDWTKAPPSGDQDQQEEQAREDPNSNPDPGRAWYDPDEGRWVYPDDPTIGFRPSRKGMSAEPAKAYLEEVERRYQPATSRPPFESPWLSRTHRPYTPGQGSMISPRGFQQEKSTGAAESAGRSGCARSASAPCRPSSA